MSQNNDPSPLVGFTDEILMDAMAVLDSLSGSAVRLLFHVAGLESCARGVCCAKARTLATRMGCSDRTVRRRWAELGDAGLVKKLRRCCRTSWRGLTLAGEAAIAVLRAGGSLAVSAHMAAHKGDAESSENYSPCGASSGEGSAGPPERAAVDPGDYVLPRAANALSKRAWSSVASWLASARSISWGRCRMAHRAFSSLVVQLHRCREWSGFSRAMVHQGRFVCPEDLVRLAIDDARSRGRDFGTVESALRYVSAVVLACVSGRRLPGERPA